jgi:hypothetical protein
VPNLVDIVGSPNGEVLSVLIDKRGQFSPTKPHGPGSLRQDMRRDNHPLTELCVRRDNISALYNMASVTSGPVRNAGNCLPEEIRFPAWTMRSRAQVSTSSSNKCGRIATLPGPCLLRWVVAKGGGALPVIPAESLDSRPDWLRCTPERAMPCQLRAASATLARRRSARCCRARSSETGQEGTR